MKGDKLEINQILRALKDQEGQIDYRLVLSGGKRLPELFNENPRYIAGVCAAAITMAFEGMNLSRAMNADQILDLVDTIIDSSNDDRIGIEDLMLFLQGLVRGEYGVLYESMDVPKFMEKFEVYRQARHKAFVEIKYEQHSNNSAMGIKERESDNQDRERELNRSALGDYLKKQYSNPENL